MGPFYYKCQLKQRKQQYSNELMSEEVHQIFRLISLNINTNTSHPSPKNTPNTTLLF